MTIWKYDHDEGQYTIAAIACGPATISINHFIHITDHRGQGAQCGQTLINQLNILDGMGSHFNNYEEK